MNCKRAKRMISLYIDGELKKDREKEMFAHLETCSDCKEEMKFMSEMLKNLSAEETIEPSPYFFSQIKAKIGEVSGTGWIPFPFHFNLAFPGAGLLFLIIISSFATGALLGNTYWTQVNSESSSIEETKTTFNLHTFEALPEGSLGNLHSELLGGA